MRKNPFLIFFPSPSSLYKEKKKGVSAFLCVFFFFLNLCNENVSIFTNQDKLLKPETVTKWVFRSYLKIYNCKRWEKSLRRWRRMMYWIFELKMLRIREVFSPFICREGNVKGIFYLFFWKSSPNWFGNFHCEISSSKGETFEKKARLDFILFSVFVNFEENFLSSWKLGAGKHFSE